MIVRDEAAMHALAAEWVRKWKAGDVVLLDGPLGAGKTTFVRGAVHELGFLGAVRSPTFNLIQTFETVPPVMHADLYRVGGMEGLGAEDYLETHLCFIEWPDRAMGFLDPDTCWQVSIDFENDGRRVTIIAPL